MTTSEAAGAAAAAERLRAELFLAAVLPLLEPLAAARPGLCPPVRRPTRVHFGLASGELGATLLLGEEGGVRVLATDPGTPPAADLAFLFRDAAHLNRFFAGRPCWPRVRGAWRHPRLLSKVLRWLMALRILRCTVRGPRAEQALQVRLLLMLVGRALAHLARRGQGDVAAWVADSPERVFQWTAGPPGEDPDQVALYLRMAQGRVQVGRGIYGRRRAFVHVAFRDVEAAWTVLTSPDSQMSGVRCGLLETIGSPEYTRKLALQMQAVDALLMDP